MRYQLPVYPILVVFAAWMVSFGWRGRMAQDRPSLWHRRLAISVGAFVAVATLIYAVAFSGIYGRPITRETASRWLLAEVPGPVNLVYRNKDGTTRQPVSVAYESVLESGAAFELRTTARAEGLIEKVTLPKVIVTSTAAAMEVATEDPQLHVLVAVEGGEEAVATATCVPHESPGGFGCALELSPPLETSENDQLLIRLSLLGGGRQLQFVRGAIANETGWDDGLPLRLDGYDPFGGVYQRDLSLELYWNDDDAKRERIIDILDRADFLVISSNRQWGSLPRMPERFPLVTSYYRHLLGCPPEREVASCFIDARPGTVRGDLGFELAAVFESPPSFGPFVFNDQIADEAFTVYDQEAGQLRYRAHPPGFRGCGSRACALEVSGHFRSSASRSSAPTRSLGAAAERWNVARALSARRCGQPETGVRGRRLVSRPRSSWIGSRAISVVGLPRSG
jgi:hypothetical protein